MYHTLQSLLPSVPSFAITVAGLLLSAFLISIGLSRLLIFLGPKLGLMDLPDARRVHVHPVPRAGGLAIWSAFLVTISGGILFFPEIFEGSLARQLIAFAVSGSLLLLVGVVDDRHGMRPLVKLAGQVAAAGLFFILTSRDGFGFFGSKLPLPLEALLFIGWAVLIINAFNLIDGLDGLCGGLVFVSLMILAGLEWAAGNTSNAFVILLMAAAVTGFLRYNYNPARIFLGDAGSMLLGFFLASVATQMGGRRAVIGSILLPLAIAGVPLLDVFLAIWRRSVRNLINRWSGREGVGLFSADKDHLHHRLMASGLNQQRVAFVMQSLAAVMAALVFIPMLIGPRGIMITVCLIVTGCLFGLRHLARIELNQTGSLVHLVIKRRTAGGVRRILYFVYDIMALTTSGVLALLVETNLGNRGGNMETAISFVLPFVIFELVAMQILRVYRRVWSRATFGEFVLLALALILGGFTAMAIFQSMDNDWVWSGVRFTMIAVAFAISLVVLPRALPEILRELNVSGALDGLSKHNNSSRQLLVYGAGDIGNLFVKYLKTCRPAEFDDYQVCGYLDDSPSLKKRMIQGFAIHGGKEKLIELCSKYPIHGILIAMEEILAARLHEILDTAARLRLNVYRWQVDLKPRRILASDVIPDEGRTMAEAKSGARRSVELTPGGSAPAAV